MAVMVHHGLFVGGGYDAPRFAGSVLHCARDPWFVDAKQAGFPTMPDTRDTVICIKYNEMALNLVDAADPRYFWDCTINTGLQFITDRMAAGDPILVHCNAGVSRSPSIALLWMWEHGFLDKEFQYVTAQFRNLYRDYMPGNGVYLYLKNRIEDRRQDAL